MTIAVALLCATGCGGSHGTVTGYFRVPGGSAAEVQRGGLNFAKTSEHLHGVGSGHTVQVGANGEYTVRLPSGSYSVIGALSGEQGHVASESCGAAINVTVRADSTTRVDFVCHPTPVSTPRSTSAP
jgi:hypothetical protein